MNIDETLKERGTRYGNFMTHANITQDLKRAMVISPNWPSLADDQKEALEMVAHKIGRILNGDPDYHDSWHDIVGYTKLVADRLLAAQSIPKAPPVTATEVAAARNAVKAFRDAYPGAAKSADLEGILDMTPKMPSPDDPVDPTPGRYVWP